MPRVPDKALGAVMRQAITTGNMKEALDKFGQTLAPEHRAALGKINSTELAALRSLADKHLDLPGDKLA